MLMAILLMQQLSFSLFLIVRSSLLKMIKISSTLLRHILIKDHHLAVGTIFSLLKISTLKILILILDIHMNFQMVFLTILNNQNLTLPVPTNSHF